MSARNQSILAHGFAPVGKGVFTKLWDKILALAEIEEGELPSFPRLNLDSEVLGKQLQNP